MKLRTLLGLGYVLVFTLMIILAAVTFQGITSLSDTADWVAHTQKVIRMANLLEKQMVDMETGQRGFLITGNEEFLEPHHEGEEKFTKIMTQLKNLVSDNPAQVKRLENIDNLEKKWLKIAIEPEIIARKEMKKSKYSMKDIAAMIEKGTGKRIMDEMRGKFQEFLQAERDLLVIREKEAKSTANINIFIVIFGTIMAVVLGVAGMIIVSRFILKQVGGEPSAIADITGQIAQGNLDVDIEENQTLTGILASIKTMLLSLKSNKKTVDDQDWLKTGIAQLNDLVRGENDVTKLSTKIISEMTSYMESQIGALYLLDKTDDKEISLVLTGSYAYKKRKNLSNKFKSGEGLVGQAFLERQQIVVSNVPEDYVKITSGLGESVPRFIVETPFMFEDEVIGVIEIGSIHEITDLQLSYLEQAVLVTGISFNTVQNQEELGNALQESQALSEELQSQSEELQSQQEELKAANEELEAQTETLKRSEGSLIAQQEELQAANEELEEKTDFLEKQRSEITEKNDVLAKTGAELEAKAKELEISSRYKSEFLANMSHELRTPLNSILLLSRDLAENKEKHLDEEEVECADIVYKSGNDLLNLINEILNLSKIESGKMTLELKDLQLKEFADDIKVNFARLTKEKELELNVKLAEKLPESIKTDAQKLDQIIKNLIFNASKFTDEGSISISIDRPGNDVNLSKSGLHFSNTIAISVSDTGIGIPEDKQHEIFEAFQQADGSTSRKYGGTGLGLSICRELSKLLGGEIQLESKAGEGATFTLYLSQDGPEIIPASEAENAVAKSLSKKSASATKKEISYKADVVDDRNQIKPKDNSILVIEDDPVFAKILVEQCVENGFKCLVADNGEEGLQLAMEKIPKAIILDIRLPEKNGWEVLDELKSNPNTRNIPIHVMSSEDDLEDAFLKGVVGTLNKPVSREDLNNALNNIKSFVNRKKKTLLIVEDDEVQMKAIKKLISRKDVKVFEAGSGEAAVKLLKSAVVDCVILDLKLPDMSGFDLLDKLDAMEDVNTPPVIVYTAKDLSNDELNKLEEHSETVIVKGGKSEERLLDEAALFLHRVVEKMPKPKQAMLTNLYDKDNMFKGRKLLVVDDDMRNVFALSKILKEKGVIVEKAENGKKAIKYLEENDDIDLILMDIMMPEMNGYDAIKQIRDKKSKVKKHDVFIFALTAKAMKQDKEKCIEAGADDYLSKPLDTEKLFSMMRVWLYR
jgi:CheY-like chemotaxis protein/signal transduction histidine kinase/CHASE3 domain sensor protein